MDLNINSKFCLIGNSHISQFIKHGDDANLMDILYGYGASICGLFNQNSYLQLSKQILNYQSNYPNKTLVFFLGQSDIEFIYYYKSVKQNEKIDINSFIDNLIEKYIHFLTSFITNKYVLLGINPHVIKDIKHIYNVNFTETNQNNPAGENNSDKYKFEDYLHIYNDTYETRFKNSMIFNEKLKQKCENKNINYITINDTILDLNQNVKNIYMPNGIDHHLVKNMDLYTHLILKLRPFL